MNDDLVVTITLPAWLSSWTREHKRQNYLSSEDRMRLLFEAVRKNTVEKTGGPFAAAVFEQKSGALISLGVNRVVANSCSAAHAEILAISLAQQQLKTFDLGGPHLPAHELVINGDPCAMCLGSIPWSGVRSVVTACTARTIEEVTGFDEGPVHPNWKQELERRGITVRTGVLVDEGRAVLQEYRDAGLPVYNGRQG